MDWAEASKVVVPAISAVAGATGAVVKAREATSRRASISKDVELLKALPDDSTSRRGLRNYVDKRVKDFITFETTASREIAIGVFALLTTIVMALLSIWLIGKGGWYLLGLLFTVPLGLVCAYGIGDSFVKAPRDEKGNRIEGSVND